jgi:exopolyphosphatase/guanosine-5'-triphosphate,3'-diphosphate pyrophosphatase
VLLLAQKGNLRKVQDALSDHDVARAILALRLGIVFMHARLDPAIEPVTLSLRTRITIDIGARLMSSHPTLAYWLAKEKAVWEEVGWQFAMRTSG